MSAIDTPAQARPAHARGVRLADNDGALGGWFLAPAVVYIALLVGFPFLLSMYYSVSDATVGNTVLHYVGLENFERVTHSNTFWRSMRNTFVFTLVSQVLVVILAKILAMALYKDRTSTRLNSSQ